MFELFLTWINRISLVKPFFRFFRITPNNTSLHEQHAINIHCRRVFEIGSYGHPLQGFFWIMDAAISMRIQPPHIKHVFHILIHGRHDAVFELCTMDNRMVVETMQKNIFGQNLRVKITLVCRLPNHWHRRGKIVSG